MFAKRRRAGQRYRCVRQFYRAADRLEGAVLFEVRDVSDPRTAVQAIKAGKGGWAVVLDTDRKAEVQKAVEDLVEEWVIAGKLPPPSDHA